MKILLQAQNKHYKQLGVAASLKKVAILVFAKDSVVFYKSPIPHQVVTNEGTLALFKGNTAQMARIQKHGPESIA